MHHQLEVILPPTDNVEEAIKTILADFDEDTEDRSGREFFDYFVIGGRWAGNKLLSGLDQNKLEQFNEKLEEMKVTVLGLQCGKQELSPASQIPAVDSLWREFFPDSGMDTCPLFNYSNDQYHESLSGDVCKYSEVPGSHTCSRIIFADSEKPVFMLSCDIWNGVNHEKTAWDGTFAEAKKSFTEKLEYYTDKYKAEVTPKDDWLVVTVDYHS